MKQITEQERLDLFNDTLEKCGLYLLKEKDEVIAYNIYEEFDIGVISFLHTENLQVLYDKGLISKNKYKMSILLRNKVMELQNNDEWDFENFRISEKWKEIMVLSDEIKRVDLN